MSSIYLPAELKVRLIDAARRRGFVVERGRQSQLAEYLEYLVGLDERTGPYAKQPGFFEQARGLLATPGVTVSDEQVEELLAERRIRKYLR